METTKQNFAFKYFCAVCDDRIQPPPAKPPIEAAAY